MFHKSRGRGVEKTLHDDFVHICIHLTARERSVYFCIAQAGMTKVLKVSRRVRLFHHLCLSSLVFNATGSLIFRADIIWENGRDEQSFAFFLKAAVK